MRGFKRPAVILMADDDEDDLRGSGVRGVVHQV